MNKYITILFFGVFLLLTGCSQPLQPVAYGDPAAAVRMDIYSDYKCAHCADFFKNTFPALKETYVDTGKVYTVFHEYPVFNEDSWSFSRAALCMYQQRPDAFFDIHTALYNSATIYHAQTIETISATHQLPIDQIRSCITQPQTTAFIQEEKNTAEPLRITHTPTFRIGNQQVQGNLDYEYFVQAIELELGKK